MADSTVSIKDASNATVPVDSFTQASGDHRQAVVIGDPAAANVASVGTTGGLSVRGAPGTPAVLGVAAGVPGTLGPVDVSEAGNVTFIVKNFVAATAYTGNPVVVFEQSDDSVSWSPYTVVRSDNGHAASTHTLPPGTANGSIIFDGAAEGINWVRARCTTAPTTNNLYIVAQPGGMPFSPVVTAIDRKDAGRTNVNITYTSTAPVVADTLLTLAVNKGATATSVTTVPVTAGRIMRITGVIVSLRATAATLPFGVVTLRVNYSGAAVIGSTAVAFVPVSGSAAAIGNAGFSNAGADDGFVDLSGTAQLGVSFSNNVTTNVAHITVLGYEFAA